MMKAVALFSGGLDSVLAIKVIQEQGIKVHAVAFTSPFFINEDEKKEKLRKTAKDNNFHIHFIKLGKEYLKLVKDPKHGHGKNMNPCIDCHAFMFKKANSYAKKIKAKFIFTGEVLDERPMSQNKKSLEIVAEEAGLKGKILRPLSAKLLEETEAEKKGFIDRKKLLDIRGRSRKQQFELAKRFKLKEYETPAGGCLLTDIEYSKKLKDLIRYGSLEEPEIIILKAGRHFRFKKNKIIVGRDKEDNNILLKLRSKEDYVFEAKDIPGPVTLLKGPKTKEAIQKAAALTARYSDAKENTKVKYGSKEITSKKIDPKDIDLMRI